jgi:hypothetical protein
MNKPTLVAALATAAVILPAGWRALDADIQADGPETRPELQSMRVGDATVTIQFDRGVMMSGGTVSGVLVATSDRPHAVTVDVTALEDMGFGGERVPNPPQVVGVHSVKLQAQPGGGPPAVTTFKLGGKRARPGHVDWYTLRVTAGDKPRRHRQDDLDVSDETASAGVTVWTGNTLTLAIEPPAAIPAEGPFTIAVRIKNPTTTPVSYASAQLGEIRGFDGLDQQPSVGNSGDYTVADVADLLPDQAPELAPGAERLFVYKITPARPGIRHFTFTAYAQAGELAAMDVRSVDRPEVVEPAPSSVAAR